MKLSTVVLAILLLIIVPFARAESPVSSTKIDWHSYKDGMARGKFEKKQVLIHFYADWCSYCKVMEEKTFQDPNIIASINDNFIPVKVDYDRETETSALYQVRGLPDTWFVAEDGMVIGNRPGYISPEQMKVILELLLSDSVQKQ